MDIREKMCYTLLYLLKQSRIPLCVHKYTCEGGSAPFNPPKIKSKGAKKMEDKNEKKEPKRTRPNQIKFFVSDSELEKIDKKIKKSKMTKSDYLRNSALGKEIIIIEDFKEFFIELKKQGTNINQIARALNNGSSAELGKFEEFTAEYKKLNALIGAIVGKLKWEQ